MHSIALKYLNITVGGIIYYCAQRIYIHFYCENNDSKIIVTLENAITGAFIVTSLFPRAIPDLIHSLYLTFNVDREWVRAKR